MLAASIAALGAQGTCGRECVIDPLPLGCTALGGNRCSLTRAAKMNLDNTGGERHEELYEEDARLADDSLFETAAFERFDLWMDGSLKLLVTRYQSLAAPQASRPFLSCATRGRSRKSEGTS